MDSQNSSLELTQVPSPESTVTELKPAVPAEAKKAFKNKAPNKKAVKVGIIFIGGCGCNNAEGFMEDAAPSEWPHVGILLINSDGAQLDKIINSDLSPDKTNKASGFDFKANKNRDRKIANLTEWRSRLGEEGQLCVIQLGEDGDGAGADPEEGKKLAEKHAGEIEAWMTPFDVIIIVAGVGKGTGGGATPVVQRIAVKEAKKPPLILVTMPFEGYGKGIMKNAVRTLRELYENGGTVWAIYNNNAPKEVLEQSPEVMYDMINRASTLPALQGSREVTQVVGMVNADTADWKKVIHRGNLGIIYYAEWPLVAEGNHPEPGQIKAETLEEFTGRLLNGNPYQDTKHKDKITTMLTCFHGPLPQSQQNHMIAAVTKDITEDKLNDLEIIPFFSPGSDGKRWVFIVCTAQVEDPLALPNSPAATASVTAPKLGNGSVHAEPPLPLSQRTVPIYFATSYASSGTEHKVTPETAELFKKATDVNRRREEGSDIDDAGLIELIRRETGVPAVIHRSLSVKHTASPQSIQ